MDLGHAATPAIAATHARNGATPRHFVHCLARNGSGIPLHRAGGA